MTGMAEEEGDTVVVVDIKPFCSSKYRVCFCCSK
jgi:hypothetical protein